MINILEVFGEPIFYGGQESFVMDFLRHMDKTDLHIDLLTPYFCDNHQFMQEVGSWGGKIVTFGLKFSPGQSRFNIVEGLDVYLKTNKYDIVHVHSGSISVLALVAECAKKNNVCKVIVHSHCGIEKKTPKNFLMRQYGNYKMKNNVDIYCACSKVAGKAKFTDAIVKGRLKIVNNGIDLGKYRFNPEIRERIRKALGIGSSTYVIGHAGRFSYQKNHKFLVEIFKTYSEANDNTVLILLGDGELKYDVVKQIEALKLKEKVFMPGNVNNVYEYLQAFDIFLLPSRYEGLPMVGVEAQAAGLPTIVSANVSDELAMIETFKFLPINRGADVWVEQIKKFVGLERRDQSENILTHGYDINATAVKIREMYIQ